MKASADPVPAAYYFILLFCFIIRHNDWIMNFYAGSIFAIIFFFGSVTDIIDAPNKYDKSFY